MQNYTSTDVAVLALELIPAAAFGFAGDRIARLAERWPRALRIVLPALCALPYAWVSYSHQIFWWRWLALYMALPVAIAWLLNGAAIADPEQRGTWRDAVVLLALGLAVDLRCLEPLWPRGLAGLGKLLLVDAGLYGFVVMRQLRGTGFDFHFRWSDWKTGLRELVFFAPLVIGLGLALGFLHPHTSALRPSMALTWVYIFVFHRRARGTLFSRMGAESARKKISPVALFSRRCGSPGANPRPRNYEHPVRTLAFQQAFDAFQLALCDSGDDCRDFLRARLAPGSACACLRHHARQRRCDLVAVVLGNPRFESHVIGFGGLICLSSTNPSILAMKRTSRRLSARVGLPSIET